MEFREFKIGESFFTGPNLEIEWKTTDIGSRWVIAFRIDDKSRENKDDDLQDNIIFYEFDFGGCSKTRNN